jgi:hypothetical protein
MSFINEILKISFFLPDGVKIDFENIKHASDAKAVKKKKTAKIHDLVCLAPGILPSPNPSRITGHPWK